jgi:hypothetical protein
MKSKSRVNASVFFNLCTKILIGKAVVIMDKAGFFHCQRRFHAFIPLCIAAMPALRFV